MNLKEKSIRDEIATIKAMVLIYCKKKHKKNIDDCEECKELIEYAINKIQKCPHEVKPKCNNCKIHCYKNEMREKTKLIMRYSGKKIIYKHPILAIKHFMH
ncbi:MAG: nitrous oxide-stimulated promoter family protein [Bacteroidales bacterium]